MTHIIPPFNNLGSKCPYCGAYTVTYAMREKAPDPRPDDYIPTINIYVVAEMKSCVCRNCCLKLWKDKDEVKLDYWDRSVLAHLRSSSNKKTFFAKKRS